MNDPGLPSDSHAGSRRQTLLLCSSILLTLIGFFAFVPKFSVGNINPTLTWLYEAWNDENKLYEHGWMVVVVMAFFLYKAREPMKKEPVKGSNAGLWWIGIGIFFWVGGFRAIQARAAVLSLPFFILGSAHFVWGWKVARHLMFPLSLFGFMIPLPGLEQATNGLAIISTKIAHHIAQLFGIESIQSGTRLFDPSVPEGEWKVDEGCSGIRSLVALLLVSYAYAMVVHRKWAERMVIFASAIPIAIVANGFRITSILVVGKINRTFAAETWHHSSGFFSFGAALAFLMLLSFIMRRGLRALRPKVKVTRIGSGGGDAASSQPVEPPAGQNLPTT